MIDEAEEDEDEELGHAETYAEYKPPKRKHSTGASITMCDEMGTFLFLLRFGSDQLKRQKEILCFYGVNVVSQLSFDVTCSLKCAANCVHSTAQCCCFCFSGELREPTP